MTGQVAEEAQSERGKPSENYNPILLYRAGPKAIGLGITTGHVEITVW